LQTHKLAASFEGLNSFLAQSAEELWNCEMIAFELAHTGLKGKSKGPCLFWKAQCRIYVVFSYLSHSNGMFMSYNNRNSSLLLSNNQCSLVVW